MDNWRYQCIFVDKHIDTNPTYDQQSIADLASAQASTHVN